LNNYTLKEVAAILNERGYKTGTGRTFDSKFVGSILANYGLKTRYARLRNEGKLTVKEVADLLKVQTYRMSNFKG
jgi:hypothetical protein